MNILSKLFDTSKFATTADANNLHAELDALRTAHRGVLAETAALYADLRRVNEEVVRYREFFEDHEKRFDKLETAVHRPTGRQPADAPAKRSAHVPAPKYYRTLAEVAMERGMTVQGWRKVARQHGSRIQKHANALNMGGIPTEHTNVQAWPKPVTDRWANEVFGT